MGAKVNFLSNSYFYIKIQAETRAKIEQPILLTRIGNRMSALKKYANRKAFKLTQKMSPHGSKFYLKEKCAQVIVYLLNRPNLYKHVLFKMYSSYFSTLKSISPRILYIITIVISLNHIAHLFIHLSLAYQLQKQWRKYCNIIVKMTKNLKM